MPFVPDTFNSPGSSRTSAGSGAFECVDAELLKKSKAETEAFTSGPCVLSFGEKGIILHEMLPMNDAEVRENFHRKRLRRQHAHRGTLVVNELGLNHGRCRADIAIINERLIGYEIKSDSDSLKRLMEQVRSYNAIFDRVFVIVGERHVKHARKQIPKWWGMILSMKGPRGAVNFQTLRKGKTNDHIDPMSVARLLWRNEVVEMLRQRGVSPRVLRQPRANLYECLVSILGTRELRRVVRECLKARRSWRCRA
jgi:hypothetical protein